MFEADVSGTSFPTVENKGFAANSPPSRYKMDMEDVVQGDKDPEKPAAVYPKDYRSKNPEDVFRALYEKLWSFCAGWNRVPFRSPQIGHMLRVNDVELSVAPLGKLEAVSLITNQRRFVGLNSRVFPSVRKEITGPDIWRSIRDQLCATHRFILMHELSHIHLHTDQPEAWQQTSPDCYADTRWRQDYGLLRPREDIGAIGTLGPAVMREIEADIFSLVALIPDSTVWGLAQRGHLNEDGILDVICDDEPDSTGCHREELRDLARYRIEIFFKFAHIFRAVSTETFTGLDGVLFKRVETIDGVSPEEVLRSTSDRAEHDLSQIIFGHPLLKSQPLFCEAVSKDLCPLPFYYLLDDI